MTLSFPLGSTHIQTPLRAESCTEFCRKQIKRSLTEPDIMTMVSDSVPDVENLAIIVPDGTRPLPVSRLLAEIRPHLEGKSITIFIAKGSHRSMTEKELEKHIGSLPDSWSIIQNSCDPLMDYTMVGTTPLKTEVRYHKAILNTDAVLAFTLVRPHYYAGFSGGRKIFLPGCAHRTTIQGNHRHVLDPDPTRGKDPRACLANLEDNPVHRDMVDSMNLFPNPFTCLHFTMDGPDLSGCYSGRNEAFLQAVSSVREQAEIRIDKPFDTMIVSSGGAPKDINFIQSHKAVEHVARALKDGGNLYFYADCPDGIGNDEMETFLRYGDMETITRKLYDDFRVYGHTALSLLFKLKRFRIHMHSSLPSEMIKLLQVDPWDGVTFPENMGRIAVVRDASNLYLV